MGCVHRHLGIWEHQLHMLSWGMLTVYHQLFTLFGSVEYGSGCNDVTSSCILSY